MEKQALGLPSPYQCHLEPRPARGQASECLRIVLLIAALLLSSFLFLVDRSSLCIPHPSTTVQPSFIHLSAHCADLSAISVDEHASRLMRLAETLKDLDASAYIAEPGPSASYFFNVSLSSWFLSERPLLLIVKPDASVTVITPYFEATRAKLLAIPSDNVTYVTWAEDANPYEAALKGLPKGDGKVFVDGEARYFIAAGLAKAGSSLASKVEVDIAPAEVRALRERKTAAELQILRCVNEVTLLALREVRDHIYLGMKESEAKALMIRAMAEAGLTNPEALVMFGPNAALPHGSGTDRVLIREDFVLMDIMGSLHGYRSDLTRTYALATSWIPSEHVQIWYHVQKAQQIALAEARNGTPAGYVDRAPRAYLYSVGLGKYFTHRLGHGIGLEVHESPYLLPGNFDVLLAPGNTFSDEPGVYIEGDVGVRLEDCFVVTDKGELLTEGVGGAAKSPWQP